MASVDQLKAATGLDIVRLSPDLKTAANELGPLADLLGTWFGTQGFNMIAVPYPITPGRPEIPFTLLVRPYAEIVEFTAIGAKVPNRRAGQIDYVTGLMYELRITDLETNQPMHIENGMWLNLDGKGGEQRTPVARLAAIPHGDSFLALGSALENPGPPAISPVPWQPNPMEPGWAELYQAQKSPGFDPTNPTQTLKNALAGQNPGSPTLVFSLSSKETGGGVLNVPFVNKNADATSFDCTFWLERINQQSANPFLQLQYVQTIVLEFGGHSFPHINVNTMVKQ